MLCALMLYAGIGPIASAIAKPWWMHSAASDDRDFLDPDVAFRVGAQLNGDQLHVRWLIADGYYLYRQKFQILAESADLRLGPAQWPRGTMISDEFLGTQEIYVQQVEATVHVMRDDYGAHPVQIKVIYQGCAKAGFCYPAIVKVLFPGGNAASIDPSARTLWPWQLVAIFGALGAFLIAGLRLRKGRMPVPTTL
ncbi:MAG: protein-disulfide reductase DsbD domain-containing protein [Steroidobacterales bacterium]